MDITPTPPDNRSKRIREKLEREFCCSNDVRAIAIKMQKNGVRYCYQCQRCSEIEMLRARDLAQSNRDGADPFDTGIKERWWKARSTRSAELYDQGREKGKAEFDRRHQEYLRPSAWRRTRDAVLKGPATEVRHLTYVRVGREMLFDLVAFAIVRFTTWILRLIKIKVGAPLEREFSAILIENKVYARTVASPEG